jgi:hypothetical protein
MLSGSLVPSALASTDTRSHVPGMNCIGPTARSKVASPSSSPPSESAMWATPSLPSRAMPRIGRLP